MLASTGALYKHYCPHGRLRGPQPKFGGDSCICSKLIQVQRLRRNSEGVWESIMAPYNFFVCGGVSGRGRHAQFCDRAVYLQH